MVLSLRTKLRLKETMRCDLHYLRLLFLTQQSIFYDPPYQFKSHNWVRDLKTKLEKPQWCEINARYYVSLQGIISLAFKKNYTEVKFFITISFPLISDH